MSAHDDDVHFFDGPGIEEGNGSVPVWFLAMMGILFVVLVAYLGVYLVGAQPNTASIAGKKAAAEAATEAAPAEGAGESSEADGDK